MNENAFSYTYSAPINQEVLNIRKQYLPRPESKLEELKRLNDTVQTAGIIESLCAGIGGWLIFGLGVCLSMEEIGHNVELGVILGLVGALGMLLAYPIYRGFFSKAKTRHTPRILELADELSRQN